MASTDELTDELRNKPVDERKRIEIWRAHMLIQAGYPRLCAERMSEDHTIDLHQAIDLVMLSGCNPYVAERILS